MTIEFTVEGELRGAKRSLGPSPVRIETRVATAPFGVETTVTIPVPPEAAADLDRLIREQMPERVLTLGHGGHVTITVTIED